MTDLMWTAVKDPVDGHYSFDKEGLDLAFKYFTCSTLTIRLAGITQINVSDYPCIGDFSASVSLCFTLHKQMRGIVGLAELYFT